MKKRDAGISFILILSLLSFIRLSFTVEGDSAKYGTNQLVLREENFLDDLEEYCFNGDVTGLEGIQKDKLKLEKISVLLRHGDRTPMAAGAERKTICDISSYVKPFLHAHGKCLPTSVHRLLIPFLTSGSACKDSQLTVLGILQHMSIGRFLRHTYSNWFTDSQLRSSLTMSTFYSRSALSLISLLSAFDPHWCQDGQPQLEVTDELYFQKCDGPCRTCPARDIYHKAAPGINKHDWPSELIYMKKIFANPDIEEDNWQAKKNPDAVADFVTSNFCHQKILPKLCTLDREKLCVSMSDYHKFFVHLKSLYRRRHDDINWPKYNFLQIINFFKKRVLDQQGSISFYSGHDIGIEAALVVLGMPLDHHVPYASRLIFEQWIDADDQMYVRILLNGQLVPIRNHEYMSLDDFESYLNYTFTELFQLPFSWENYDTACTVQFKPIT